jgi:hypothetical protein
MALTAVVLLCSAHVGSPDVWFEGNAGPYAVRVYIRPPEVVPGLAEISIRVANATRVTAAAAAAFSGPDGAPPPDVAVRSATDPDVYSTQLWLMKSGAYRVAIDISGAKGAAKVVVPVDARAATRRPMPRTLGFALGAGGLFLLFGLMSIAGSAARESLLPPGIDADAHQRRKARVAMGTTCVVAVSLLFIGWRWWQSVDARHIRRLDHPWSSTARIALDSTGARTLLFDITDSVWTSRRDTAYQRTLGFPISRALTPDHNKAMHMFVIRNDMTAFAHLHPTTRDETHFEAILPGVGAGHYRVFGDIVEGGSARTITTALDVPDAGAKPSKVTDPDDATWSGPPFGALTAGRTRLDDSLYVRWVSPDTVRANEPIRISADAVDGNGRLVQLNPYMGMAGHAAVANTDGSVFIHLHPMGTISMAAQMVVQEPPISPMMEIGMAAQDMALSLDASHLAFPYAFPRAGKYRVWIQFDRGGHIFTVAHDIVVIEP